MCWEWCGGIKCRFGGGGWGGGGVWEGLGEGDEKGGE